MEMPDGPPPSRPPAFHPLADPPGIGRRPLAAPMPAPMPAPTAPLTAPPAALPGRPGVVPRNPGRRPPPAPALAECADPAQAASLLNTLLGRCRRQGHAAAVLWVQLQLTDPAQHAALVPVLGLRLRHRVRATDHMAQVGADAFMVVLMGAGHAAALLVRSRLEAALREPCGQLADVSAALLPRVGCSAVGEHGSTAGPLLRVAGAPTGA